MPDPLTEAVLEEIAQELAETFLRAKAALEHELSALVSRPETFRRQRRIAELQRSIDRAIDQANAEVRRWADTRIPDAYRLGAREMADDLGVPWSGWTQIDTAAVIALSSSTFDDFLARTSHMSAEAKRLVREVARGVIPLGEATGQTIVQTGRQFRDLLASRGVTTITYRNGAVHSVDEYARMAARTKSATVRNLGGIAQAEHHGVQWLECFDGPACGWGSHYDLEPAHGRICTPGEAADLPIAHPNCARSFGPRPDVKVDPDSPTARQELEGLEFNPLSAEERRQARQAEIARERARDAARARRARPSRRQRRPPATQRRGRSSRPAAQRARAQAPTPPPVRDPIAESLPPWARGTSIEDAKRQFDKDGGFLPMFEADGQTFRPGAWTDDVNDLDAWVVKPPQTGPGRPPALRLTEKGQRHEELLRDAGRAVDDEISRRLAPGTRPKMDEAQAVIDEYRRAERVNRTYSDEFSEWLKADTLAARDAGEDFDFLSFLEGEDDPLARWKALNPAKGAEWDEAQATVQRLGYADRMDAKGHVPLDEARKRVQTEQRDAMLEVLAELRDLGFDGSTGLRFASDAKRAAQTEKGLDAVTRFFPREWLDKSNAAGSIFTRKVSRGFQVYLPDAGRYNIARRGSDIINASAGDSAIALSTANRMGPLADAGAYDRIASHELMHRFEEVVPDIKTAEWAFHQRRTHDGDDVVNGAQEATRPIYGSRNVREVGRFDQFLERYMGRVYEGGNPWSPWEHASMGAESLFAGTHGQLIADRDYRRWMLGVLTLL